MRVARGESESIESLIRRFSKTVQRSGLVQELREREGFVGPAERRRLKRKRSVARARREALKTNDEE